MKFLSLVDLMQHLIDQNLKRLDIEANVMGSGSFKVIIFSGDFEGIRSRSLDEHRA